MSRAPKSKKASIPHGAWPLILPPSLAAGILGFTTTAELLKASREGNAPKPCMSRKKGANEEPLWTLPQIEAYAGGMARVKVGDKVLEDQI